MRADGLKTFLESVGGPRAISFVAWVGLSPVAVIGPVYSFEESVVAANLELLLGITALSYIISGLVFLIAYRTYLKPNRTKSRPAAALVTFFVSGALAGFLLSSLSGWFGIEPDPDYLGRTITRGWFGIFWSSIVALFLDSRFQYREAASKLSAQIAENRRLISERSEIVESVRAELVESVRATLAKIMENPSPKLLSRLADEVIRPLSRAIQQKGVQFEMPNTSTVERIRVAPILANSISSPPQSLVIPLAAGLSAILGTLGYLGAGALTNLALFVLIFTLTLRLVLLIRPGSLVLGAIIWLFGLGLLSAVTQLVEGTEVDFPYRTLSINAGTWLLAMILNFQVSLESAREQSLGRLAMELESSFWHRKRLQQEVWVESRRLAKYVHGDIQGRIRAAALASRELSASDLENLREACLEALESRPGALTLDDFFGQSKEVWGGVLEIKTEISKSTKETLNQDDFASEAVIETLREALVNAVRHGEASFANISLSLREGPTSNFVEVRVTNNGYPIPVSIERGIGSELFDEVSTEWSLNNSADGVVLLALVPVTFKIHAN